MEPEFDRVVRNLCIDAEATVFRSTSKTDCISVLLKPFSKLVEIELKPVSIERIYDLTEQSTSSASLLSNVLENLKTIIKKSS